MSGWQRTRRPPRAALRASLRTPLCRVAGEDGVGLVEVLVALMVMGVALLSMVGVATVSLTSLVASRQRQEATAMVSRSLELARSYDYVAMAMASIPPGDPAVVGNPPRYDPDGAGTATAPEPVVLAPAGLAGLVTGAGHQSTTGPLTLRTYVTAYDDPAVAGTANARRVTAVATWPGGESVRQSTIVAEVARGPAAPTP